MIDIAIIGAGPAGLSAAINGIIRNKKVKVFGNPQSTSYIYKAERVDNFIGMLGIDGKTMMEEFTNHAREVGVPIQTSKVIEIFPMGDYYMLNVDNEFVEARTIILANGLSKGTALEGENTFLGKGVSYCATCDGLLYRGKAVAVIGDSNHAEEEVNYLSEICEKVYYVPLYKDIINLNANVEVILAKPKRILGDKTVRTLELDKESLEVSGIFIIKESIPAARLLKGIEMTGNAVKVNRSMETNMKGVYAAGDCTGRPYQVAKAIGEGNVAALQAVSYLHSLNR